MMTNFSDADLTEIREAVRTAEGETSGEIVPFVTLKSGDYVIALWRAGVLFALVTLIVLLLIDWLSVGWTSGWVGSPTSVVLIAVLVGAAGALAAYSLAPLKRLFTSGTTMAEAVHRRALQAFVEEEVFDTRDRTGILLFVSLFERRIEVLGDAGINAKVSPDDWGDVVHEIRDGIVSGRLVEGLVSGIRSCGALLTEKGVAIRPDDRNELSDGLRVDND